jgi:hypothetical protein
MIDRTRYQIIINSVLVITNKLKMSESTRSFYDDLLKKITINCNRKDWNGNVIIWKAIIENQAMITPEICSSLEAILYSLVVIEDYGNALRNLSILRSLFCDCETDSKYTRILQLTFLSIQKRCYLLLLSKILCFGIKIQFLFVLFICI